MSVLSVLLAVQPKLVNDIGMTSNTIDANLISQLVGPESDGLVDRRKHPRFPYPGTISVASYDGSLFPVEAAFHSMRGCNLSLSGIAFFTPVKPGTELLVIRLAGEEYATCLICKVVHCSQVEEEYLVGCKFVARLEDVDRRRKD